MSFGRQTLLAATILLSVGAAHADDSPSLQNARRHLLDGNVNVLTFHSVDRLFPTRRVESSGTPSALPRAEAKLDFTYSYGGQTRAATEIFDRSYTNALVILKHGRIVFETYRNLTDAQSHFISFSMAKSITSILIGIALADGSIRSLDDPITAYVPELAHSAYDGVTIQQALDMRSGANYLEVYAADPPNLLAAAFEESFVQRRTHFADYARIMTRAYPPGTHYNYSTFETCVLGWVLERATKRPLAEFMTERLWKPAGMESYGFWMLDGPEQTGREFAGGGYNATARDYARIGLLMLKGGRAGERQVVPERWVRESTQPAVRQTADPMEPEMGYHDQWWPLVGSQAFMARGLQGQAIFVDPATDTVIVKLSYVPPGNATVFPETIAFLKAASLWEPAGR